MVDVVAKSKMVPGVDESATGGYNYIGGRRCQGLGAERVLSNPATGSTLTSMCLASVDDVDKAVATARGAFPEWSRTTPSERSAIFTRWAQLLTERSEDIAMAETLQCGKPIRLAREFDVPGSIDNVSFFGGVARNLDGKAVAEYSPDHTSMIRREPIGVVGSIAPWNYPLQMAAWKALPAIAAGNTVVLKPSELTPLTTLLFAEAATDAGLPNGVLNVIVGTGPDAGEGLVGHPGIDMVSFTGSSRVGRRVMELAAATPKRVHLELGGKAPFLVFDDANLDAAVNGAVAGALINTGQDCTAATRAYVQRALYEDFVDGVTDLMLRLRLGDPRENGTDVGSLISKEQQQRVAGYVDRARDAGARIVCGGAVPRVGEGDPMANGAYYLPTLVTGAKQDSEIMREEIFGPVLTVLPFDDDEGGIAYANDTPYGLAASAWSTDVRRCLTAMRELRAGTVWINDHIPIISEMPHGGYKASGFGKDMSSFSLEDYTVVKHVMYDTTGLVRKDWHSTVLPEGLRDGAER